MAQAETIPKPVDYSSCGERAGGLTLCSRLKKAAVELKCASTFAMSGPKPWLVMATLPQSEGRAKKGQAMSTGQLWQEFFSDPSMWWDSRGEKKSPSLPDFRYKHTKEVLWIEGWSNPPGLKANGAAMIQGQVQSGDDSNEAPRESTRMAGVNQAEYFVGHQPAARGGTSAITTALVIGQKDGVSKDSSDTCEYIRTLCKAGQLREALHILSQKCISADSYTYVCILQGCINIKALAEGKQVHTHIIQSALKPNITLLNTLVNMYAKCGSLEAARQVFDRMLERDVFTWTIMVAGYAKHGCGREALKIFEQMRQDGVMPNRVTFISVLDACASLGDLEKGKEVHADIIKGGIVPDIILENTLVHMYCKCMSMKDARQVLDNMAKRSVVSWSAMIAGYAKHGDEQEALKNYEQMQWEGVMPDRVTFISVLDACAGLGALEKGKEVHADIVKAGIASYINLENTLVAMYAKCGSMEDARQVFDNMAQRNVVSWNAMITAYAQHGYGEEAFLIYEQMQWEGVNPNKVTFISVLNACASLGALGRGREVHADLMKAGIDYSINLENALVNMYVKCGSMVDACEVFNQMSERDLFTWTIIMVGCAQRGHADSALEIYEQMQQDGAKPDKVTFACVLDACANLGFLEKGEEVHAEISRSGIVTDIILDTALADMYAKCGDMKGACRVFDAMAQRDLVSWNAMIAGYAQHGCGREALKMFEQMQRDGFTPDSITFISLLSACGHVGLVDEGHHYFDSMSRDHGLTPTVEHFGCMVDLLGRAGRLDEAEDHINKMPIEPHALVWKALLGACRIHGNVEVAERASKGLLQSDPQDAEAYVLLSNIYAVAGRWDNKELVRKMMEDTVVEKEPDRSCIEVENRVHTFIENDMSHPQIEEIHSELNRLSWQLKDVKHVPDMRFAKHNVEDEQKEFPVSHHSEKLAMAFGLMSTPPGKSIRVIKSLRICGDCHTETKLISKFVGRTVVLRDANRFHHFQDGVCSCEDYW